MNNTLLGQAVIHFSQTSQSDILILSRLKNEPNPILILYLTLPYYSFLFFNIQIYNYLLIHFSI